MTELTSSGGLHPSLFLTPLGWVFVLAVNIVGFRRAELSRIKDKVVGQVEKLFSEIEDKISDRGCSEAKLDDLLTNKVTLIEFRVNQFEKKSGMTLLSADTISGMRDKPFDWLVETGNFKRTISDFEYSILEEIENNYSKWLFEKWWKSAFRICKDNFLELLGVLVAVFLLVYCPPLVG
ncbi:hypothetical protein P0F39_003273 [Vibrio metschnikovii]|nr:hypothetical protein [Vibrio metschnikovii]EKO3691708.1 hypothetical protein [Vibrio metschnikovii]EKO3781682.1 hypothetical protein [Vibrio metschnikovii]EKO3888578.1 hypothetical protein [Vibrio metschnikovii]EKO3936957.1 hypothetical protein [Vibrio metschnikovii]